jgi:hypothetical protein
MFGRKNSSAADDAATADAAASAAGSGEPLSGPFDASEVADDGLPRVDLGGLLVLPRDGVELRLQADQANGVVSSVLLATADGAVELRAFAAPKSGGLWDEVRREIAAEATRQGGTATESDGSYGPELRLQVPVRTPDGRNARQVSRIVGVEGPRWFLRGTFLGTAATDPDPDGPLEQAFAQVVVVRGQLAMPPREGLPMRLPHDVRASAAESDADPPA